MAAFQIDVLWWSAQWRTPGKTLLAKARRWMMPRPPDNRQSAVKTVTEYNRSLLGRPVPGAMSACALQRLVLALDGPPALVWQRYRSRDYGARGLALRDQPARYLDVTGAVKWESQVNHLRATALWLEEGFSKSFACGRMHRPHTS